MKKAFADIPEGQIHYRTEGSGDPLLLLHQTPLSSEQYSVTIPILAANGYRVLAMDTLGYGYSDDPPKEYSIADYGRSAVNFLDSLGIARTSIVGHYTGAAIAAEVAAAFPERVDRLILSGCPYWPPEKWQEFYNNPDAPGLTQVMTEDGQFLIDIWQSSQKQAPQLTPPDRLRSILNILIANTRPYDAHHAVDRYDFKSRLPLIQSPTLLIYGSGCLFRDRQEITERLIPYCRSLIIEGARETTPSQKPKEFASAILEFLRNTGA